MFDPTGSHVDLSKRILQKLKAAKIQHQLFETLAHAYDGAIAEEPLVLSRAERKRLFLQTSRSVLEDLLAKFEEYANGPE